MEFLLHKISKKKDLLQTVAAVVPGLEVVPNPPLPPHIADILCVPLVT